MKISHEETMNTKISLIPSFVFIVSSWLIF